MRVAAGTLAGRLLRHLTAFAAPPEAALKVWGGSHPTRAVDHRSVEHARWPLRLRGGRIWPLQRTKPLPILRSSLVAAPPGTKARRAARSTGCRLCRHGLGIVSRSEQGHRRRRASSGPPGPARTRRATTPARARSHGSATAWDLVDSALVFLGSVARNSYQLLARDNNIWHGSPAMGNPARSGWVRPARESKRSSRPAHGK